MPETTTEADLAELAIAVYVEELAADKRVLYVGDLESRAPERLAKVARSVELVSPRARVRGTRRGGRVQTRRWPTDDDSGRWDVVVIPDLTTAGLGDEAQIEQVGAWLADGGVLVAGSHGEARGLGYEAFFDLLSDSFESVRMIGQASFRGFALVDFAPPGDLEVTFDGSLLDGAGESAERFLALCGDEDVVLDAYTVVQIPSAAAAPAAQAPRPAETGRVSELTERVREQQDALDAANVHAEELEHEIEAMRADLERLRAALTEAQKREGAAEAAARREIGAARAELERRIRELEGELARAAQIARASESPPDEEYARLETQLRESGRELTEARAELERRAVLVRDLVEELAEQQGHPAPPVEPPAQEISSTIAWSAEELRGALQQQVAEAVERAVRAETEKAELAFRLDEVRGQLALTEQAREHDLEELRRLEAALRGTVRGLNARLAEVVELYQLAQARIAIADEDLRALSDQNRALQRDLAEARESLELEIARATTIREVAQAAVTEPPPPSSVGAEEREAAAAREAELTAALARCRGRADELEAAARIATSQTILAREALAEAEERVGGMRRGYEARIAEVVAELQDTGGEAERALVQVGELRAKVESMDRAEARLRGELAGTKLRLADREEAVAALLEVVSSHASGATAPTLEPPRATASDTAAIDALRAQLEAARADAEALRAKAEEVARPADDATDLRAALGARDALVARLQAEVAGSIERQRELAAQLETARASLEVEREQVQEARVEGAVGAEETVRELEELTDRLERSETERRAAVVALEEARAILEALVDGIPAPSGDGATGPDTHGLRERLLRLEAQAADREVLLRSLTAQLQERDDRIRALERFDPADGEDPNALKAELLEMRERAARLAEELENEREARRRLE